MSTEKKGFQNWMADAASEMFDWQSENWREAARWWQREWLNAAGSWKGPSASYFDAFGPEWSSIARQWWTLSQDYYRDLSELNTDFARRVMDEARFAGAPRAASRSRGETVEAQPARSIPLRLAGPLGQSVEQTLVLENMQHHLADIAFFISDVTDKSGGRSFRPAITIEPARFTLAPQQEQSVRVMLDLDAAMFSAGEVYNATVVVHGYPGLTLALRIEPGPAEPPAAKKTARSSASPKKGAGSNSKRTPRTRSGAGRAESQGED